MLQPRWLQVLRSLGLEFWLLLPLLGLVFWFSSGLLTNRLLNRSYTAIDHLELKQQREKAPRAVVLITIAINQIQERSKVIVQLDDPSLKELKFEFQTTASEEIEAAISRELALPQSRVKELARYYIEDE